MSRIRVTIDRIALRGMGAGEGRALVEGLQGELSRILADPAARSGVTSRRTPVLRLGGLPMGAGSTGGRTMGKGIARAIGRSLKP
jgi:hypothetical protein